MPIDFTKPIETVPCPRNPIAVPCSAWTRKGADPTITILHAWIDHDGLNESGVGYSVDPETGKFSALDGAVRNVVQPAAELPTLRDQFAMAALGLLDRPEYSDASPDTLAIASYVIADAMLKARAK